MTISIERQTADKTTDLIVLTSSSTKWPKMLKEIDGHCLRRVGLWSSDGTEYKCLPEKLYQLMEVISFVINNYTNEECLFEIR